MIDRNMRGHLSHIEIYVSDLERSSSFWGWFLGELGYVSFQSWDKGQSWKLGMTYFVIVQAEDDFKTSGYHRKNVGLNHVAFHAESREDVDQMAGKLKAKNIPFLYPEKHPEVAGQTYAVYFEDPDRIKVEFVATPK
jgi:catechol 2,3-dioxygenase-like lactoylglutathione lyase family enzyme